MRSVERRSSHRFPASRSLHEWRSACVREDARGCSTCPAAAPPSRCRPGCGSEQYSPSSSLLPPTSPAAPTRQVRSCVLAGCDAPCERSSRAACPTGARYSSRPRRPWWANWLPAPGIRFPANTLIPPPRWGLTTRTRQQDDGEAMRGTVNRAIPDSRQFGIALVKVPLMSVYTRCPGVEAIEMTKSVRRAKASAERISNPLDARARQGQRAACAQARVTPSGA